MNNQTIEFLNDENTIDVFEVLKEIWKYKFLVIGLMIFCMLVVAVKMICFTPYTYTADGVLYVSNKADVSDDTDIVNKNDIDAARTMSETYIETLKTRDFLMSVSDMVGEKYSWEQIKKMMDVSAVNQTELLSVKVTANSPSDAYRIANAITTLAPEKLSEVCEGGSISVIDSVILPTSPNSKGTVNSIALGGIVGIVLAVLLIVLFGFFDTKVHKSEDVAKRYDISILGELSQ